MSRRLRSQQEQFHRKESFSSRLRQALKNTRIEWYAIPAAAGIGFLGAVQFFKVTQRESARREEEERASAYSNGDEGDPKKPKKRKKVRPSGPWFVFQCLVKGALLSGMQVGADNVDFTAQGILESLGMVQ